jgi:hypothetical protein
MLISLENNVIIFHIYMYFIFFKYNRFFYIKIRRLYIMWTYVSLVPSILLWFFIMDYIS